MNGSTPRLAEMLRPDASGFRCPGCQRPLARDDIHLAGGTLIVELIALRCSARYELRLTEGGDVSFAMPRPCIESPLPLFHGIGDLPP